MSATNTLENLNTTLKAKGKENTNENCVHQKNNKDIRNESKQFMFHKKDKLVDSINSEVVETVSMMNEKTSLTDGSTTHQNVSKEMIPTDYVKRKKKLWET